MWDRVFKSQAYDKITLKHRDLPIYETSEFDFFRCIEFREDFYGKTASELHNGNLRICEGRYSNLFPNQKLSYWANSMETARAEVKKHGAKNNLITFWAYDDNSSTFPTVIDGEDLRIVDGRKCGIQSLIDKVDNGEEITQDEQEILRLIIAEEPDCLSYDSHAVQGGENFIFFEKGFKKLSLRQVRLRLGNRPSKNACRIVCADSCDYTPFPKSYGEYFSPIARVEMDESYLQSEEYLLREQGLKLSHKRYSDYFQRKNKK